MSIARPLLQLRKELNSPGASAEKEPTSEHPSFVNETNTSEYMSSAMNISIQSQQNHTRYDNAKVLTENEKYIVKRLAPDLSSLPIAENNQLEGLVDTKCGKALVNDTDFLYIWDYQSCQKDAEFCKIPLHEEYAVLNTPPKCLFTWPAAMDDSTQMFLESSAGSSGGVCIIQRKNSKLIYFEDIDSVNNLNSKLSKSKAHVLDLKLKDNESVTMAINCEPAGIVISTSFGRLLFVTLRDSTGRLKVQLKQQLVKSQTGFLFHSFNSSKEIVSSKVGAIVGRGERLLHVVTKGGDFKTFHLSLGINCFKRVDINLFEQVLDSLQGLYPFAHGSLQVLDSHPLFPDTSSAHVILSSIANDKETYYILSTVILDEKTNSFTIFSTYRLNTYVTPSNGRKPKLIIPDSLGDKTKAVTTVFVLFSNAVVLTQVSSNLDSSFPLRRKWEDIISLRENIEIIGSGYNSESLFVMTKEMGILEVMVNNTYDADENDNVRFVKSHIDQAIYFSDVSLSPIEFNLPKEISLESSEIEHDLILSSDEVFFSRGKYIPPMLSTLTQHLGLRVDLYKNLLKFIVINFNHRISHYTKLELLEKYEIMNCCLQFSSFLQNSTEMADIWSKTLSSFLIDLTTETFMVTHLDKFPQLFTQFLCAVTNIDAASKSLDFKMNVVKLAICCLYDATLELGENKIRFQEFKLDPFELNKTLPWFVNVDTLTAINNLFFDYKFSVSLDVAGLDEKLLPLIKFLYYSFNQVNLWFNEQPERKISPCFATLKQLYDDNHLSWSLALCELSLQESSIQITEFYRDLEALVGTLETLEESVSQDLYLEYFEKFGYDFASTVFEHYIKVNKLRDLFFRFPTQHDFLVQFFENSDQYGNVAWIQQILDNDYEKASATLSSISVGENCVDQSLEQRQLHLSLAKLSAIAEEGVGQEPKYMDRIQADLDLVEGQQDLVYKLKKGEAQLCPRYQGTEASQVYDILAERVKSEKILTTQDLVEIYTMLNDKDSHYCALKLLALSGETLDFESKGVLIAMVWRRCILFENDWSKVTDTTETCLYQVLYRYFDEELYRSHSPLPSYALISKKDFFTEEYLLNCYGKYTSDINSIEKTLVGELEAIKSLGKDFEIRIKSIIGTANESTGNKCTVNYESNTVEF